MEVPMLPITSEQTLINCKSLDCTPRDIFIASYPKSGTTWTQHIVYQLLTNGDDSFEHISHYAPFFEVDRTWDEEGHVAPIYADNHARLGRRVFNTHLRWGQMPCNARYIYLMRNGKDVVTSFYHHLSHQDAASGGISDSFDDFFSKWIHGEVVFGNWMEHIFSWTDAMPNPDILMITYEELKRDLVGCVTRIADHIGVVIDEEGILQLIPKLGFDYMSTHAEKFQPVSVQWKSNFRFIRKGEVGDHINLFEDKHMKLFEDMSQAQIHSRREQGLPVPTWIDALLM